MSSAASEPEPPLRVAVVGPCASGKSTLIPTLRAAGYETRHPAQEHSYVPDMWRRLSQPDVLIYLDASYTAVKARRPHVSAGPERLAAQRERLAHARQHCDFYLDTSDLTPEEVQARALAFLRDLTSSKRQPEPDRP